MISWFPSQAALLRVEAKVDRLLSLFAHLEQTMSKQLDALTAQVKATTDAEQSAIALIAGLKKALDDAIASGDPKALEKLAADLAASQASLAAAVVANTPPPAPPAPAVP